MQDRNRFDKNNLQLKIYQSLGLNEIEDQPGLDRARKELHSDETHMELSNLKSKSQRKNKRIKEMLLPGSKGGMEISEEMKELEWRLEVLRSDRRQRQDRKKSSSEQMTFDELYNRQRNKYSKFRERTKIKVSDPKYLDMIGSMQMRREKRKLEGMDRIQQHIAALDMNIKFHSLDGAQTRSARRAA